MTVLTSKYLSEMCGFENETYEEVVAKWLKLLAYCLKGCEFESQFHQAATAGGH